MWVSLRLSISKIAPVSSTAAGSVMALCQQAGAGLVPVGSLVMGMPGTVLNPTLAGRLLGVASTSYGFVILVRERAHRALSTIPATDATLV